MAVSTKKLAVFRLKDEDFAIDITDIITIEKDITLEKAEGFPTNVKGIIHLRGDIIPVYSLRGKFNIGEKDADDETRIIIASSNGIKMAYEVDSLKEIATFETAMLMELPSVICSEGTAYLKNIAVLRGALLLVLDINMILPEGEHLKIKKLLDKGQ